MNEINCLIPLLSALAGGALVGILNFLKDWQNRKSEEKRHLQELMFKSAVEEWKQDRVMALEVMKTGKKVSIEPLLTYIIQLMKVSEKLTDGELTKENVLKKLTEVREFMNEVKKFTALPKKKIKNAQPSAPPDRKTTAGELLRWHRNEYDRKIV